MTKTTDLADIEARLDALDPAATPAQDARDLRAIAALVGRQTDVAKQLHEAVTEARRNGKSWAKIAIALGTTRQSAHERYTDHPH